MTLFDFLKVASKIIFAESRNFELFSIATAVHELAGVCRSEKSHIHFLILKAFIKVLFQTVLDDANVFLTQCFNTSMINFEILISICVEKEPFEQLFSACRHRSKIKT